MVKYKIYLSILFLLVCSNSLGAGAANEEEEVYCDRKNL